jgi:hypothetical protein
MIEGKRSYFPLLLWRDKRAVGMPSAKQGDFPLKSCPTVLPSFPNLLLAIGHSPDVLAVASA